MEQIRKEIIEEERIKLLREHAHRLLGYLPKVNFDGNAKTRSKYFVLFRVLFEMRKIWIILEMISKMNSNDDKSICKIQMDGTICDFFFLPSFSSLSTNKQICLLNKKFEGSFFLLFLNHRRIFSIILVGDHLTHPMHI